MKKCRTEDERDRNNDDLWTLKKIENQNNKDVKAPDFDGTSQKFIFRIVKVLLQNHTLFDFYAQINAKNINQT